MTHDEKVAHLLQDLGQKGVGRYTIAPLLYRLLWRLGIKVRPPLFASFWSLVVITGLGYGLLLFVLMWPFVRQTEPVSAVVGTAALAAVLFGLFMAVYYRARAQKLGLQRWEDYPRP
jgi:ABC-type branched-subunit amino acid transport system permease subunit